MIHNPKRREASAGDDLPVLMREIKMRPELVQLTLDSRPTDNLPHTVWTYGEMGDVSEALRWDRTGGGWRTTFTDGSRSHAHATRELRRYSTPSTSPLIPRED